MRLSIFNCIFVILVSLGCSNSADNANSFNRNIFQLTSFPDMPDTFRFSYKDAHVKAKALMNEEFLWSAIEETAPFGNDDGSDAAYGFRLWRVYNKNISPTVYLDQLIDRWGYPKFELDELDTAKISLYLSAPALKSETEIRQQMETMKEAMKNAGDTSMQSMNDNQFREIIILSSQSMGASFLVGIDNAIIATGFAQFVLEGELDQKLKSLVVIAIKRQLLPVLINRWDVNYIPMRKEQLNTMLNIINKVD